MNKPNTEINGRKLDLSFLCSVIAVGAISFYTYHFILGQFFTGTDTLTLIETSQIRSASDLLSFFTEPLMSGSKFLEIGKFFRPIANISYSLDILVWGLNPFGFQLTNLMLNTLVSCLLVLLVFELSAGKLLYAFLSGLIFSLHPVLIESVPAIDRRHDILVAAFSLLSLLCFLKGFKNGAHKKWLFLVSVLFYGLSLGSKETAVVLPVILACYVYLNASSKSKRSRIISALRHTALYWLTTTVYLIWRNAVLEGMGGYVVEDQMEREALSTYIFNIIYNYCMDLIYPVDPLGIIDSAYANFWIPVACFLLMVYLILFLKYDITLHGYDDSLRTSRNLKFLSLWSIFPLGIFLVTLTFSHRSMYNSVIPFSALVAYPLAETLRSFDVLRTKYTLQPTLSLWSGHVYGFVSMILGASMFFYIVMCSPLVRSYDQWGQSSEIGRVILSNLTTLAEGAVDNCNINLYNLPDGLRSFEGKNIKAKEVTYLNDYSIKSWLRLCGVSKNVNVVVHSRSRPWNFSGDLGVVMTKLGNRNIFVVVQSKKMVNRNGSMKLIP